MSEVKQLHHKCLRCKRVLKKPAAQERGMGDVCARKWEADQKRREDQQSVK